MNLADLQLMACDPRGSHIMNAFTSSPFIKLARKEILIDRFKVCTMIFRALFV